MRGCHEKQEPKRLSDWLAMANTDWQPSYPFNDKIVKQDVIDKLFIQQRGLCVYCGRSLNRANPGKSFHVEHFRPQHKYPALAVDFANMYLSCGQKNSDGSRSETCGTRKDRWFEEDFAIEPSYPDCMKHFSFSLNGTMRASTQRTKAADKMIEVLNLNHPELTKDRETIINLIDSGQLDENDFWDENRKIAEDYAHVAFHHLDLTIP